MNASERAVAEALWRNVDDDFTADGAHTAFIEHCRRCDDLAFAAQRYRDRKQACADRAEPLGAIDDRLKAIAAIAMSQLGNQPAGPPPGDAVRRVITVVGVVFFVLTLALLIAALQL